MTRQQQMGIFFLSVSDECIGSKDFVKIDIVDFVSGLLFWHNLLVPWQIMQVFTQCQTM